MYTRFTISESLGGLLDRMDDKGKATVSEMMHFYHNQYQDLKQKYDPLSVAANIQRTVQEAIDAQVKSVPNRISCAKGCSFCCFQMVDITNDEAELLTQYASEEGIEIDYDTLEKQIVNNNDEYMALEAKTRRCIFLDKEGGCSVYEHRPMACRKLIVVSDSKHCDTELRLGDRVGKLVDLEAEVLTCSSLNATMSGSMAKMLIKTKK